MTNRRKFQRVLGRLGLLGVLAIGGPGGVAWAGITIVVKQPESVAQNVPNAVALPAPPNSAATRQGEGGASLNVDKQGTDKSTAKAK